MRAVVTERDGHVGLVDIAPPEPGGRAVVQVELTGLCGTDLKIIAGQIPVTRPRILGHEVIGRVVTAGSRGIVPVGARVLVNPVSWCGYCAHCLGDRSHLCPNGAMMGRDEDGGLAERIAVDKHQLHPIPEELDGQAASLLQVLGTCVHAQTLVDVLPGQSAAVIGLGVSGLLHTQLLRERGIDRIIGVTRTAAKRELAEELGASRTAHPDDARAAVNEVTDGRGVDLVVEAAGAGSTLSLGIDLAAIGGTLLAFGITPRVDPELPAYQLYFKELALLNARAARARDYARAVALTTAGRLDLARLWTRGFPLEQATDAFDALREPDALKVALEVQ